MSLKSFHSNFALILSHAIIGTVVHFMLLGMLIFGVNKAFGITDLTDLEIFIYAALISAVDPVSVLSIFKVAGVNDRLNILVGSESMLNDAVSIVLYRMFVDMGVHSSDLVVNAEVIGLSILKFIYVSTFGIFVGLFFGIVAVSIMYFNRRINAHVCEKDHSHYHKMTIVIGFSFLAYFVAESTFSSGIIAILFCGIVMNAFGKRMLVPHVRKTMDIGLHVFAQICESLVFLYLGIDLIIFSHKFNWIVILVSNVFILSFRFMCVYTISYTYNVIMYCLRRRPFIPFKDIFIHAFSGIRGAIAFALAFTIPSQYFDIRHRDEIVTNSFSVILFTIFFQGTIIGAMIGLLDIKRKKRTVRGFVRDLLKIMKYLTKMSLFLPPYGIHIEEIQEESALPRVDDDGVAIDIDAKIVDALSRDSDASSDGGEDPTNLIHASPSSLKVVTGPISSSHPIFGTIFQKDFVESFKKLKIVLDRFELPKIKKPVKLKKHEKKVKKIRGDDDDDEDRIKDVEEEFDIARPGTLELKASPSGEFYVMRRDDEHPSATESEASEDEKKKEEEEEENLSTTSSAEEDGEEAEKKEGDQDEEFVFLTDMGGAGTALVKSTTFEDGIEFIKMEGKRHKKKLEKEKRKEKKNKKRKKEKEEEVVIEGSTEEDDDEEVEEGGEEAGGDETEESSDGEVEAEEEDEDEKKSEKEAIEELDDIVKNIVRHKKKKKRKKKKVVENLGTMTTTSEGGESDDDDSSSASSASSSSKKMKKKRTDEEVVIDIVASPSAQLIDDVFRSPTLASIGRSQSAEYLMKPSTTSHYISLSKEQEKLKLLIRELKKFVETKNIQKLIQDPEILKEQRFLILSFQRDMAAEIEKLFSMPDSDMLKERMRIPGWQKKFTRILNFL